MGDTKKMLLVAQLLVAFLATSVCAKFDNTLPSYHYGAPIKVECMNRSSYAPLGPLPFRSVGCTRQED